MKIDLKKNTIWGVAEVVCSGFSLFLLYKYIILFVGVKGLGLWSLVLSTTSLARLADIGAAAGLTRFVALGSTKGFDEGTAYYIDTAYALTFVLYSAMGLMIYIPIWHALASVVPADSLTEAHTLLPFAIASLVLLNLNGVTLSGVMGIQRADLKSKIVICSLVAQIVFVVLTIKTFGLLSLAWGQMLQYGLVTIVGRIVLMKLTPGSRLTLFPYKIARSASKDLFSLGMKLQVASLVAFVFEPFTKLAISSTAVLEALGLLEMASRLVLQVRHIAYVPMQSLVSAFVHVRASQPDNVEHYYLKVFSNACLASFTLMAGVFMVSPVVSYVWLGHMSWQFVDIVALVCIARFFHLIATPAYMMALSEGKVVNNLIGHVITSFVFPSAAYLINTHVGNMYVVVIICMMGMAVGEMTAFFANSRQFHLRLYPSRAYVSDALSGVRRKILSIISRPVRG